MNDLDRLQNEIYGSMDRWSQALGWGLTGSQPECFAMMDSAVEELAKMRKVMALPPDLPMTRENITMWAIGVYHREYGFHDCGDYTQCARFVEQAVERNRKDGGGDD